MRSIVRSNSTLLCAELVLRQQRTKFPPECLDFLGSYRHSSAPGWEEMVVTSQENVQIDLDEIISEKLQIDLKINK